MFITILRYIHNLVFINILGMFISISWLYVIRSMDTAHDSSELAYWHCIMRMYDFSLLVPVFMDLQDWGWPSSSSL